MDRLEMKQKLYTLEVIAYDQGKGLAKYGDENEYERSQEFIDHIKNEILDAVFPEPEPYQPKVGDKVLYYDLQHKNPIYAEVVMETGNDLHPYLVSNAFGVTYAARREQLEAYHG